MPDSSGIRAGEASRTSLAARWAALAVGMALLSACGAPFQSAPAQLHARVLSAAIGRLPVNGTVIVGLDQPLDDAARLAVSLEPPIPVSIVRSGRRLLVSPMERWMPATSYRIHLDLAGAHQALHWQTGFSTQPRLMGSVSIANQPLAAGQTSITPAGPIAVSFPTAMAPASVQLSVNGQPVTPSSLQWSPDGMQAQLSSLHLLPGQQVHLVLDQATAQDGDVLTDPIDVPLSVTGVEPSNGTSGIGPGFATLAPLEIVVENSGPARPQNGLQQADIVFEYISEYSVSRMTALYFNGIPGLVGPVRSCRLINVPVNQAFHGYTMCSGASNGTINVLYSQHIPVVINDWDRANHFYRVGFKYAPHNVYTDPAHALKLRREWGPGSGLNYVIDSPHPDVVAGDPAPAPSVPLHSVSYAYNASTKSYARYDHGAPFIDANLGRQLQVKNVVLLHVGYEVMNYVEDVNGGARSIHYELVGSGPAEIYSDGAVVHATWHMGSDSPIFFTDAQGNFIRLNTGLTWIHVLGNGQTY